MNEICDNAIDDDEDGLIDFNDPDCDCPIAEPKSFIPNPSFEDQDCCPTSHSRLDCAETWGQASEATTDYIHLCGFSGWPDLEVPLPIPDGEGCIGFRDGRPGIPAEPLWKEYVGGCLTSPLQADSTYRFEFYMGFVNENNSPGTTITFFGTTDCEFLPFDKRTNLFGCPTNYPNWVRLSAVSVVSLGGWVQARIKIVPNEEIRAIAVGPSCVELPSQIPLYYFFDNLILADEKAFEYEITEVSGHPCEDNYTLSVPLEDTLSYQWYKNGVALVGETTSILDNNYGLGDYQNLLIGPNSCRITKRFFHTPPVLHTDKRGYFCEGANYDFHGKELNIPGIYLDTLKSYNNCDSIIELELFEESNEPEIRDAKISSNESYQVGSYNFQAQGEYTVKLNSINDCDSTILLRLSHFNYFIPNAFSPNGDGINDKFLVFGNEDIEQITRLSILDRWGKLVFQENELLPNEANKAWDGTFNGRLSPNGVYVYTTKIIFSDGVERIFSGSVTLIR